MIEKITNIPKNSLSKVPFNLIPKWIKTNKRNTTKSFFSDIKLPPSNDNRLILSSFNMRDGENGILNVNASVDVVPMEYSPVEVGVIVAVSASIMLTVPACG